MTVPNNFDQELVNAAHTRAEIAEKKLAVMREALDDLLDFAIWMTGWDYWDHNKYFKQTWPEVHRKAADALKTVTPPSAKAPWS